LNVSDRKIFISRVNQDIKANYPDGRLVTQSAAADRPGPLDDSQNACDVSAWTMYFGIFYGSSYFSGTYNFINDAITYNSNKPILDTEFGYWSSEDNSSVQKQIDVFNNTFLAFKQFSALNSSGVINTNGPLMSCTWWCMFDWYRMSLSLQTMGLYTMDRTTAKPVAATLKNAYLPYFNLDGVTTVEDKVNHIIPEHFSLDQNYPNPFNPNTKISWQSPAGSFQTIKLFDVLGREIETIIEGYYEPGIHSTLYNVNSSLSSGIYFYQLKAGDFVSTRKMVLLK
jgi:beta-glucuronidase